MKRALTTILTPALLVLAGTAAAAVPPPAAPPPASLSRLVDALGGDPAQAGAARWRDLRKLDGRVQQLAADGIDGRVSDRFTAGGLARAGSRVLVDVYVDGDLAAARRALQAQGMDVTAVSTHAPQRMVEGWVAPTDAPDVAGVHAASAVVPVAVPRLAVGSVTSAGDAAHHGPAARAIAGAGAGVVVGVMSDSIDRVSPGLAGSQATGDLPADVDVIDDMDPPTASNDATPTDEGRAMAEIVYDEAPDIQRMLFASAFNGAASKAANIDALVAGGAKVIVDDTAYYGQPWFQDGAITQAVDRAHAAGVTFVEAAGNEARQSWEGTFTPNTSGYHDFGGTARKTVATVAKNGGDRALELQWAEPWAAPTDRFTVNLYRNGTLYGSVANTSGPPDVLLTLPSSNLGVSTWSISILRTSGSGTPFLKYVVSGGPSNSGAYDTSPTSAPTIAGDAAAAAGALTVAAVRASSALAGTFVPEPFSSRGPVTIRFAPDGTPLATPELRAKPEVAGADGVATTVPGGLGAGCLPDTATATNCFLGTSAAAPSIAGIAAVTLSKAPWLSVDGLRALLTNPANAMDCTSAAGQPDVDCGSGFLLADRVVQEAIDEAPDGADTTPPEVVSATSPVAPDGTNGWFTGTVGLTWTVTDPESPVTATSGCGPRTITTDGTATYTCSATSAGATRVQTITVRRDATPPTVPTIVPGTPGPYVAGSVPGASCQASDATSGLASCVVTGAGVQSAGVHTMVAVATDNAGLTSTSSLDYTVAPAATKTVTGDTPTRPAALTSLAVPSTVARVTLLQQGLAMTVRASRARTKVVATLTATVTSGRGKGKRTRAVAVGRRTATVGAGSRRVTLTLTNAGRAALATRGRTALRLTVAGTSTGTTATTLARRTTMRR